MTERVVSHCSNTDKSVNITQCEAVEACLHDNSFAKKYFLPVLKKDLRLYHNIVILGSTKPECDSVLARPVGSEPSHHADGAANLHFAGGALINSVESTARTKLKGPLLYVRVCL